MRGEDREFVQGLRQSKSYASTIPTYSELVDQVELLADTNGDLAQARFFMHPSTLCELLEQVIDADDGETTAQPQGDGYRIADRNLVVIGSA